MVALFIPHDTTQGFDPTGHGYWTCRHELIERRAYHKWQARGCPSGSALKDWLEAEAEIEADHRRELIEHRAYQMWRERGCSNLTAIQDWLVAEREVDTELQLETSEN
jgi:hypothetical protein